MGPDTLVMLGIVMLCTAAVLSAVSGIILLILWKNLKKQLNMEYGKKKR